MRSEQILKMFEALISKRNWYKGSNINRCQASEMKRRFKQKELGLPAIIKVLKDFGYLLIAVPPLTNNLEKTVKAVNTLFAPNRIERLTSIGYFDKFQNMLCVSDAIDFIRHKYEIPCAVNLCLNSEGNVFQYTFVFKDNKGICDDDICFASYEEAAIKLLDELLELVLVKSTDNTHL